MAISAAMLICSLTAAYGLDVTLAWNPNKETFLAGYKIYYKKGTPGPPYDGTGALQGDSPITVRLRFLNDEKNPSYTLKDLGDNNTWFFVVTAYDDEGSESGYSNEVSTRTPGKGTSWIIFLLED
jgi:hypothetical protein